jgi:hypothetical protein
MKLIVSLASLLFVACLEVPPTSDVTQPVIVRPDGCFDICDSNIQCSHSLDRRCGICSFGHCTSVNPESTPSDAGTDADPASTSALEP